MTARATSAALVLALGGTLAWAVSAYGDPGYGQPVVRERTVTVRATSHGHSAGYWHRKNGQARAALRVTSARFNARGHVIRTLQRNARRRWYPTVSLAIGYARAVYGVDQSRRTYCESTGNPWASNGSHFGLLQFSARTWSTTPFAGFSPYDPVAAELAGGWMVLHGRSAEWTCRL